MENTIIGINNFLKNHNWCDFEIINLKGNLTIGGKTSFSNNYDIQITFEDVFFIQCLYEWKTDTTRDAFYIPNIEVTRKININYEIEEGYYLFRILAEDIENPMYVSARNIKFEIFK